MNDEQLRNLSLECPHCGHNIPLEIDTTEEAQDYQDECAACGDSIRVQLYRDVGDDKLHVRIDAEDEQYY